MTIREKAMQWWSNLASLRKTELCDTNTDIVGSVRRWETLTGREIEKIWRRETKRTEEKEIIYLPINKTKDTFTIGGCGKFNEEKKHLSKTEAMYLYVELHKWIFAEEKTENIYLNRLKEQYKRYKDFDKKDYVHIAKKHHNDYKAIRTFCLDTQLISFNDIELMEFEVNQPFS